MTLSNLKAFKKKCRNPACALAFVTPRSLQMVCSPSCALAIAPTDRDKARKVIADLERRELKIRKQKLKSRADHLKDIQVAFNAWVRQRDAGLPRVSCGRHRGGKYDAGHYRTVWSNPALRFERLNCHKQCVPCNQYKSGNLVEYRIELVRRIGIVNVEWFEGPHGLQKYTIEELKALTAKYRALTRELKKGEAA
ncbi:recombination protein NinG [Pseudomonas syringae]|uniref:recombination protein NinG n=1 Tax=Pseudomonas syringae TaxID=317 RepID=UPI000464D9F8|nr:recombination protein NinG [Pseudomonas syringae]